MVAIDSVSERLANGGIVVLDGGIGTELERRGAPMDHALWCGLAMQTHAELVREVHAAYIEAGADVITTNTYCTARHSLRYGGEEGNFDIWNKAAVALAREARERSGRPVAIAGSVSTYNSWNILGVDELRPSFAEQGRLLVDEGVDLLILETLASPPDVVLATIEATRGLGVPIWFAASCMEDRESGELMHGAEESQEHSERQRVYAPFDQVVADAAELRVDAMLMMHSDLAVTQRAVEVMRANCGCPVGAYPNAGYWQRPNWTFVDSIDPDDYAERAMGWRAAGAQIIGGCCGIGPEHIRAVRAAVDR